ncbi:hypothetical protein H0H92_015005 [Tricholoma furcatifolium]|nr:hypothetical protein H0H92_015005 [Tricholoma furcatifolium]
MVRLSFAALAGLLPVALARTVHMDLPIVNGVVAPDGFEREAILAGGTFPGPAILLQKDDSVVIPLHNQLNNPDMRQSTSIVSSLHDTALNLGLNYVSALARVFPSSNFIAGWAFKADSEKCPISPNKTFTYAFDTAGQTGWYDFSLMDKDTQLIKYRAYIVTGIIHTCQPSIAMASGVSSLFMVWTEYAHSEWLMAHSVLADPNDPLKHLYDVDDESTIITLADWYHTLAPAAQNDFFQTGVVPIPDSGLINGKGRFNGGPLVPFAVVNVERGKRYRLRIFAIACRPFFTFSIDNHNITFMEADGVEHDPVTVQNVDVYAAQRVSVILNANQPVDNYWIRAPPTGGAPSGNPNFNPNLTLAILRYKGARDEEPTTTNPGGATLLDEQMHLGSGPPDVAITLNIAQPNPPFFDINGISYLSPTVPVLLQLLSGAAQPQDLLPSEQIFILPKNSIIQVNIPGTGSHPFHLHGHNFDVTLPSNANVSNFVNPLRRDVYPINGGNTTFRFFSGNPGAWFLHCHIDWHLEAGLAIVFAESPADNISGNQSQIITQSWDDLCPEYDALEADFQ